MKIDMGNNSMISDRIILRSISETDTNAIFSYRSLPEIARFQYWEPFTKEQTAEFVLQNCNSGLNERDKWIGLAIINKNSNKLIGDCALKIENETAEIGCNISPDYQNRGIAKEVLEMLINYCFTYTTVSEITGITDSENEASIKLMESAGMCKDNSFENNIICKGSECTEYKYSLNKTDWQK
jgi:RimJ/RimL family protein N-acetyltransferase